VIDRLDSTTVEEWKHHPGTLAFMEHLRRLSTAQATVLVQKGNLGAEAALLHAMAGRAAQLGELIGFIENVKGREHE
jgi:hypothetical protein